MREQTYGWYPARAPWTTTNAALQSYEKECLFRHKDSQYHHDSLGLGTPEVPSPLRITPSPTYERRPSRSHSGRNHRSHRTPPPPSPKKAWDTRVSETGARLAPAHAPMGSMAVHPPTTRVPSCEGLITVTRPPSAGTPLSFRRERAKSATVNRPKSESPQRPIRSAGPHRTTFNLPPQTHVRTPTPVKTPTPTLIPPPIKTPTPTPTQIRTPLRVPTPTTAPAKIPTPSSPAEERTEERPSAPAPPTPAPEAHFEIPDDELADDVTSSYDEQLQKHGWRMEIPGDPYHLKRPFLAPRLSLTVSCKVPEIPPNPPTAHMENYDTYFYNTIPAKPLSYTIHQEWASEVLHAKRMQLQKRQDGYKYRHTNYGFIY